MTTLLLLALLFTPVSQRSPVADYVIGSNDILMITVVGEAELTRTYRVGSDGFVDLPWIGRVRAQGLTRRGLEEAIQQRLTEGKFLAKPQVNVEVQEFRSQSVHIQGEVNLQGEYPLTGSMTLVDVLAKAGLKPSSAEEIRIHRRRSPQQGVSGPVLSGDDSDVEIIRIPKDDIQTGRAARTVTLRDGDTIFVPKALSIYVMGQVRLPGPYTMEGEITVMQAIALAGGATDRAATNRTIILRLENGAQRKIKVKITELVRPGDTIDVPARWF
jgi:polysaccharide biosynthesis/export protein